jgi:hypothetical protein
LALTRHSSTQDTCHDSKRYARAVHGAHCSRRCQHVTPTAFDTGRNKVPQGQDESVLIKPFRRSTGVLTQSKPPNPLAGWLAGLTVLARSGEVIEESLRGLGYL